jgi:hypothetical protein
MPRKKTPLNPEDVYPVYDTHGTFAEGGHKIHLMDDNTKRCLCGYRAWLHNEVDMTYWKDNVLLYISQPDPDGNLCKRCKEIFINRIEP